MEMKIDRTTRILIVGLAVVVIWISAVWMTSKLPFYPSLVSQISFFGALPVLLVICYLVAVSRVKGENALRLIFEGGLFGRGWFGVVRSLVVLLILSCILSVCTMKILAGPSYLWANHKFGYVGIVDSTFDHSRSLAGYSDLDLRVSGVTQDVSFVWPSSIVSEMKPGECLMVSGRAWALGSYVDDVSPVKCP